MSIQDFIFTTLQFQATLFRHLPFLMILLAGGVLRLIFGLEQGLSHDELSAWNRLGVQNFGEILENGVIPDMHPALVQIILEYWSDWFGTSEIALRFPSILLGLVSTILLYQMCLKHFGYFSAILVSLLFALPVFPVMHSTLARPYAYGAFFIVLFVFGILNLEDSRVRRQHLLSISMIVLGATGSLYTHYFAGLACGIIGIAALFYVGFQRRWLLLGSGVLSLLLFLPHWEITTLQLGRDGLGWLPTPTISWLWSYLLFYFDNSLLLGVIFAFLTLSGLWYSMKKGQRKSRFLLLAFFAVYVASHLLSHFYTPILREPGVFMLMPLLLIGLTQQFQNLNKKIKTAIILLFSMLILGPSLYRGSYTKPIHFEPFREIAHWVTQTQNKYGHSDIIQFCNVTNLRYLEYYTNREQAKLHFDMTLIEDIDQIHLMAKRVHETEKKKALLARINRSQNVIQLEILLHKFPKIIEEKHFFNSNVLLAERGKFESRTIVKTWNERSVPDYFKTWNQDTTKDEFVGSIKIPVSELDAKSCYFLVRSEGWVDSTTSALNFVTVAEREGQLLQIDEQPLLYQAWDQMQLLPTVGKRILYTAFELPKNLKPDDLIHIYFWNRNFAQVNIKTPTIYAVSYPH